MKESTSLSACVALLVSLSFAVSFTVGESIAKDVRHVDFVDQSGIEGGLAVVIGGGVQYVRWISGDDRFIVQMLDTDDAKVEAARVALHDAGIYGRVCASLFDGKKLPYADNVVNVLVVRDGQVSGDEICRVLAPRGVALGSALGERYTKPVPDTLDDWTHYLHSASNNAVSNDTAVAPPNSLQWASGPRWTRHHDHMSSFTAMVSANGRLFYILDEGPRSQIQLPAEWSLIARDAYSGVLLWKRPIKNWVSPVFNLKSGPATLPRRVVAHGDRVYVTLGLDAPLAALDAATGEIVHTYEMTKATEEVLYDASELFVLIDEDARGRPWSTMPRYRTVADIRGESERWEWNRPQRVIAAIDAETGQQLWRVPTTVAPMTLTLDDERLYYYDGDRVVACNRRTGQSIWNSDPIPRASVIRSWFAPTLVVDNGVVLFSGGENIVRHKGGVDTMTALDAKTGKKLWSAAHPTGGYDSPEDIFVIDDLVWTAPLTNKRDTGYFTGRDLHTGEVKREFPADDGEHMPHHRCHRAKATVNYLLASRTGIEYVDIGEQHWNRNDWVRGACLYGIMPANGLTYAPPHSCACYITAKLNGLNALAAASSPSWTDQNCNTDRLERGAVFDVPIASDTSHGDDWPTYRGDNSRSGKTRSKLSSSVTPEWRTEIGGELTPPVIANGKVFVAQIDQHTVHAIDATTGQPVWRRTVGARVDSPPTIWKGRVLFGSTDGWIYCLRAVDGRTIWRFRGSPVDRRLISFEQVESVWPVHGSVLVVEKSSGAEVHAVAGRSMFLNGGLRYLRLDAATGRLIDEHVMDEINPDTGQPLDADIHWPNLPVALPDILSCDGESIYMRSQRFDLDGKRREIVTPNDALLKDQSGDGAHLFCPTGFLDDSWWHRTYWIWGKTPGSAAGRWFATGYLTAAGRVLATEEDRVYGFGRKPGHFPSTTMLEYHLFRAGKDPQRVVTGKPKKNWLPAPGHPVYDWTTDVPLLGRAIVLSDDIVFVAGPPDVVDTYETYKTFTTSVTQKKLAAQRDAMLGKHGGLMLAVSTAEGTTLGQTTLESPPVFDGMAAAGGRLYIATTSGTVVCLRGRE